MVDALTADPYGNMVEWFNFESFSGGYNLGYNESENTKYYRYRGETFDAMGCYEDRNKYRKLEHKRNTQPDR